MNPGTPCGVCVLNAVRRGVDFGTQTSTELIGQYYGKAGQPSGQIHEAVAVFAGTPVCFYHVDDAGKAAGL